MAGHTINQVSKPQTNEYQSLRQRCVVNKPDSSKGEAEQGNLGNLVYDHVLRKITTGKYPPKTKISQRVLAEELNMSVVPVREGIEKLKQHGWIKCVNRSGTYVNQLSEKEFVKLFQIREMLEAEAVIYLSEHITEKQLTELGAIVELLVEYSEKDNYNDYQKIDVEFHKQLIEFIDNPGLAEYYDSVIMQAQHLFTVAALRVTGFFHEKHPDTLEPANHLRIFTAIKLGDREGAERMIRQHIRMTCTLSKELNNYYNSI